MTAADTLKTLRLRAGFTQQQLADKAGIDRSWYNQMERGNRPITRKPAERLAQVLEISPVELGLEDGEVPEYRSLFVRLEELEARVAEMERLKTRVRRLADQVRDLSRQVSDQEDQAQHHQRRPEAR